MGETDSPQSQGSEGSPDRSALTTLADEIIIEMQRRRFAPSLALFVDCLGDARDSIPRTFEEQTALLRLARRSAGSHLKKAGKIPFLNDLVSFTEALVQCGEMPAGSLEGIAERVKQMDLFTAARYLEGIDRLSRMARSSGPHRRLITLLVGGDDSRVPFVWSEPERTLFGDLKKRAEARLAEMVAPEPIVREAAAGDNPQYQIPWDGSQIDLIFYLETLMDVKLIDADKVTDELISRVFKFKTRAEKPAENLKTTRYKLVHNLAHPKRKTLREVIAILTARLEEADRKAAGEDSEP